MIRAGRLRHRLQLQSKSTSQDAYGEADVSWTTEATVWGAIEPLSGKEYFAQGQLQSEAKVRVVIRYQSSVDTTWRIVNDGKYYDIEDIQNHNERNHMQTLYCRQGVSEDFGTITSADTFTVLDADGNSFSTSLAILDSDGNSFTVTSAVLDADGNSFTVA